MEFELSTTEYFYKEEEMKELEKLGFKFNRYTDAADEREPWNSYAGTIDMCYPTIELNSLEELIEFTDKWGEVVLSKGNIEIYDGYRE